MDDEVARFRGRYKGELVDNSPHKLKLKSDNLIPKFQDKNVKALDFVAFDHQVDVINDLYSAPPIHLILACKTT